MAWQTPKTNWQAADVVNKDDFNRIEGNIQHLEDTKETPAGAQAKANIAEANAKNYAGNLVGSLSSLATTAKNNVVAAINEVYNWLNSIASTLTNHLSTSASTSQKGHVQLSTSTTSTSTSLAATASAVKTVNDALTSHKADAAPHSGHETPAGAQAKADAAESAAKSYADGVAASAAGAVQAELNAHLSEIATQENLGHVKVDGETITAFNGIISVQALIVDTVTSDKWKWGMEDGIVFLEKVVV